MARRTRRRRKRRYARVVARVVSLAMIATALPVLALRSVAPPTTAFMLLSRLADPATGESCDAVAYTWVDRVDIAPDLRLAVVLAEDQRFLLHHGFDFPALRRALRERKTGRVRGASTLSQQVAKNLFLWPGASLVRKGIEAWLTLWIEALWSKQRILAVYLNVAQFGPCIFGAEAASRQFFGVSAAELDTEQAALLATVLPNPLRLRAHDPGPYALERQAELVALMETQRGRGHLRGL